MTETSPAEIGGREGAFETLMASLDACRTELGRLANEQAALRRVAELVASGAAPSDVFSAVASEMGHLLNTDYITVNRYEPNHTTTVVGYWRHSDRPDIMPPLAGRWQIEDGSVGATVAQTGKPARINDYTHAETEIGVWTRERGIRSVVACPVLANGRVWGMVASLGSSPQPQDTEPRMLQFVGLVGTAIASAESDAELHASRARLVAASDTTRRRIERDIHDGVQQRLISLGLELRAAEACVTPGQDALKKQLARTAQSLTNVMEDLQEIASGLHPAALSHGGLAAALKSLVRRFALPVQLNVHVDGRLPEPIEVAVYYIVSETLNNALKHAHATSVRIDLYLDEGALRVSVHDDGIGGADPGHGSGLIGIKDRVEALGGKIQIASPEGEGTSLLIKIPIHSG
jgi:signal transduction histidine kinase